MVFLWGVIPRFSYYFLICFFMNCLADLVQVLFFFLHTSEIHQLSFPL